MKSKLIAILLFLNCFNAMAQYEPIPTSYRNGFFKYYSVNPDSALFYAKKLADKNQYAGYMREAIHDDFFYSFMGNVVAIPICYRTLTKLYTDSNTNLVKSVEPLYLWAEVQLNSKDVEKMEHSTRAFIKSLQLQKDLYQNKAATYGLLIYKVIKNEKKLDQLSDELLTALISKLAEGQVEGPENKLPTRLLKKRAWYRYVYATANHYKADKHAKAGDDQKAAIYFKTASEMSPDPIDQGEHIEYDIEEFLFANRQKNIYRKEYLKFLKKTDANKTEGLTALSNMAFSDPVEFKDSLRVFYTKYFPNGESFQKFWNKEINAKLLKAPDFTIKDLNGKTFSSSIKTGKWTLIIFWGTWCTPCREEHPKLQKFYSSSLSEFAGKIEVLTIACHDTESKVNSYMKEFKYSFPVAMENKEIVKLFNVQGYPKIVLISPEGNYTSVPIQIDWVNFVKHQISL